jgi:hypothetical protein
MKMNPHTNKHAPGQLLAQSETIQPEFFPLPQRGHDPHLGLGRSTYYDLERRGLLRLVRVRKPGNLLGKVLVPYAEASALIRSLAAGSEVRK